jgi:hypothetical protein
MVIRLLKSIIYVQTYITNINIMEILAFLILSLPMLVEAYLDIRNYRKGRPDKKKGRDAVFRVLAMLLLGAACTVLTGKTWWQGALLSAGIFVMFFDYLMAWGMSKRLDYLGKTSVTDKMISWMPWFAVLFFRGIIFAICATIYYDLHKVVYGNW